MHPSVKRYLEACKDMEFAKEELSNADTELGACDLPDNLREAQPSDIVEGNVIWYKGSAGTGNAKIVDYVYEPSVRGVSFSAHDGWDCDLEGAYVEVEEETVPGFDAEALAKALEGCVEIMRRNQILNTEDILDQYYKAQEIS